MNPKLVTGKTSLCLRGQRVVRMNLGGKSSFDNLLHDADLKFFLT